MKFLFITTKGDWGGSEPLWCEAAEKALQENHEVVCVLPATRELHARHKDLIARGAELVLRPSRLMPTLGNRLRWKLTGVKNPETQWWRDHFHKKPDAICVSQGGTYCALSMPGLLPWLRECDAPYLVVCHSHRIYALPDAVYRVELRDYFLGAEKVCFVAREHILAASRFLGVDLKNATVVQNPVNLKEGGGAADRGSLIAEGGRDLTTIEHLGRCENRKLGKAEGRATESWPQRGAASGTMQVNEQPKVGPKGTQAAREAARESAEGSPSGARRAGASESTLGVGSTESKDTERTEEGGKDLSHSGTANTEQGKSEAGLRLAIQAGATETASDSAEENLKLNSYKLKTQPKMACVARFEVRDKGQDLLLEALADPVWRERDFRLDFYGSGPDREILGDLISFYRLGDKVKIVGFESDIRKIWDEHQLLVLPSLSEGTPISLIEAQICGRASLVTHVDGNPDWVEEGMTGFLAEAATVHHLRLALERAWENRHRWREMGEAARVACLAKRNSDPAGTLLRLLKAAAGAEN